MKYDICENCRMNFSELNIYSQATKEILCKECKGIESNYEALHNSDRDKINAVRSKSA